MSDNTTQHNADAIVFTEDELEMIALADHLCIDPEDIEQSSYDDMELEAFCADKCEDANATIAALIPDMEEFIEDAICADGRGHFLNFYDGEEYESNGFYIYQR